MTTRARILYYDSDHRRRQITIPATGRDNLHLDILDYDKEHGTELYRIITPWTIRKVIRLERRDRERLHDNGIMISVIMIPYTKIRFITISHNAQCPIMTNSGHWKNRRNRGRIRL